MTVVLLLHDVEGRCFTLVFDCYIKLIQHSSNTLYRKYIAAAMTISIINFVFAVWNSGGAEYISYILSIHWNWASQTARFRLQMKINNVTATNWFKAINYLRLSQSRNRYIWAFAGLFI